MIVIGAQVFAIVPKDDPVMLFMTEMDPDHVELVYFGTLVESHQTTTCLWGISLDAACSVFAQPGDPAPRWVCPD